VAFGSTLATHTVPAATTAITALGYVDYTGVWGFSSQFDLMAKQIKTQQVSVTCLSSILMTTLFK